MQPLSGLDTYKIIHAKKIGKFDIDNKVLIRLYQPVIGSEAMALYYTLEDEYSLNKSLKSTNKINRLTKITGLNIDKLNDALEKLVNAQLIEVDKSNKIANKFQITIFKTKSAEDFFNDNKLVESLEVEVDSTYYQQIHDYFLGNDDENETDEEFTKGCDVKINKITTEEEFYNEFAKKYPTIINSLSISDKDKHEIRRLARLFNLDYVKIEKAILESFDAVDDSYKINLNKLNTFIEKEYSSVNKNESSEEKQIKVYESLNAFDYYSKIVNKLQILPSEINQITLFLNQYNISQGVFCVVLDYCYRYKKLYGYITNSIVVMNITKILTNLTLNNVSSVKEAMDYFKSLNKTDNQKNKEEVNTSEEKKPSDPNVYSRLRKLMMEDED